MNSFTYTKRSDSKYSGDVYNCQIQLLELPTKYKSFVVEVMGFYSDNGMNAYLELYSDNFLLKMDMIQKKSLHVIFSTALIFGLCPMIYNVDNFNGQYINFKILNNDNIIINDITDWKLYLKMTGIDE